MYSALKDKAAAIRRYEEKPFPHDEVLEAADAHGSSLELDVDDKKTLFAWSKLEAVDYLYVLAVTTDDLVR